MLPDPDCKVYSCWFSLLFPRFNWVLSEDKLMVAVENRSQCGFIWQWRQVDCVPVYTFGNTKTSKILINKRFLFMWHTTTASTSSLIREDPLEEEMANPSSILAWTEELDRLQSLGWQSVRHDWACTHMTAMSPHCPLVWRPPKLWFVLKPLVHHHPTFGKHLQDAYTCRGFLVCAVA